MVLNCDACHLFGYYGTPGYPFSDDRIKFLDSKDDEVGKQPSLESLPGSPERDYVISNKGDKVELVNLKAYFITDSSFDITYKYLRRCLGWPSHLKDLNHKKLIRMFGYRGELVDPERAPTLVIIGPNVEFVDPCGTDILMEFGTLAYPFTLNKAAKFEIWR